MPHIIVEYSKPLSSNENIQDIMSKGKQILLDSGEFSEQAIKTRSLVFDDYILAPDYTNFLHLTLKILDGRSLEIRESLSQSLFDMLKTELPDEKISLSVDLVEMPKATYRK